MEEIVKIVVAEVILIIVVVIIEAGTIEAVILFGL